MVGLALAQCIQACDSLGQNLAKCISMMLHM
ncbi:hypothetical protein JOC70_000278 [Clostridium pascui]|nr:hypothetical protein [Clostridium pascui]